MNCWVMGIVHMTIKPYKCKLHSTFNLDLYDDIWTKISPCSDTWLLNKITQMLYFLVTVQYLHLNCALKTYPSCIHLSLHKYIVACNIYIYTYISYINNVSIDIYIYIYICISPHVLATFGPLFFRFHQGDRNQRPKSMSFRVRYVPLGTTQDDRNPERNWYTGCRGWVDPTNKHKTVGVLGNKKITSTCSMYLKKKLLLNAGGGKSKNHVSAGKNKYV